MPRQLRTADRSAPAESPAPSTLPSPAAAAKPKSKRGFQGLSKQQHRLIASRGGKTAHALGLAHEYTREEALIVVYRVRP